MVHRRLDKARFDISCWFFCVITVLSLAGVVAWLSLTPKNPCFRISDIHFPVLNSKNYTTHSNVSVPNNSLMFNLQVSNPNKRMGIYYSGISLSLYGGGGIAGANSTPGFYQQHKNTTVFAIMVRATQGFWQGMNGGDMDFAVRVETAVRFRIIKWNTKLRHIEHEEIFNNVRISSLNGTVSSGDYAELQNASKLKTRN
ncbi:hypothetical protein BUALT_Bualt03G0072200 [Buddleja alternifolia]|uniref:Late embryogenesis abundant protein LEA-2 subgroup domain-containing protein n=1 Tax=Buddleja alternifolia TaxID=168488 RepID=A0AAV6XTA3_9LAMI|nr:hypothetical protein BUALT_Bualt03G0072200 [Buddleja alternifolia]